jgi:hypothetical protein
MSFSLLFRSGFASSDITSPINYYVLIDIDSIFMPRDQNYYQGTLKTIIAQQLEELENSMNDLRQDLEAK